MTSNRIQCAFRLARAGSRAIAEEETHIAIAVRTGRATYSQTTRRPQKFYRRSIDFAARKVDRSYVQCIRAGTKINRSANAAISGAERHVDGIGRDRVGLRQVKSTAAARRIVIGETCNRQSCGRIGHDEICQPRHIQPWKEPSTGC